VEHFAEVTCPSCFQRFSLPAPGPGELPATIDYDCEVCCRPMLVDITLDEEDLPVAEARHPDD